jgi:hypothetical protein
MANGRTGNPLPTLLGYRKAMTPLLNSRTTGRITPETQEILRKEQHCPK